MNHMKKISDNFWLFEEDGVRSFLFEGTDRAMLIDTGFGKLPLLDMIAELTDLPVFLVNTHTDKDHTGRNMSAFQSSLKKMMAMADRFDTIWPSHGSYPLTADIIPGILQGAQDLLDGKLLGEEPPWPMPCKRYTCDVTSFLY